MATPWTPEQRIAAYKREGITKIVYMPGWQTHNRDDETGKPFGSVYGVAVHHTAGVGSGLAEYIRRGSTELPGPLSQDFLAKDGTLYVVGHGRCNHAGTVTPAVKAAIIAEQAPQRSLLDGTESVDGNDFLYGLEIENKGDGKDPYPAAQYDVAVRWATAHCRHHGWSRYSVWGHKEITRRKTDPSFDMVKFRTDVDRRLYTAPTPAPSTGASRMLYTSVARTAANLVVAAGTTAEIYFDTEYVDEPGDHGTGGKTVLAGPNTYDGTLSLKFANYLPAGVSVRMVRQKTGSADSGEPETDLVSGSINCSVPVTGHVPDDWSLIATIENESTSAVTLTWAGLRFHSQASTF
jgi:hypothetical protein